MYLVRRKAKTVVESRRKKKLKRNREIKEEGESWEILIYKN
jgi:hypothetical protein